MPDWFYRTVARPLLFRLPVRAARRCAFGLVGSPARVPLGARYAKALSGWPGDGAGERGPSASAR